MSALVVGPESHAAYPLAGVNAAYLAAELTAEMEFAPELGEEEGGELAAPPTVLGSRDLKAQYNVTIPGAVWTYWNVLLHRRTAKEVMEAAETLTRRALDRAAARMAERAPPRETRPLSAAWADIPILTYAELREAALRRRGFRGALRRARRRAGRQGDLDLPTRSRRLVEATWVASGLKGPAVVLGFGAMPYPAVPWPAGAGPSRAAVEAAMAETAAAFGTSIGAVNYFPAIADMSFIGPVDPIDLAEAARRAAYLGFEHPLGPRARADAGHPDRQYRPMGSQLSPLAGARSRALRVRGPARSCSGRRDESAGRVTAVLGARRRRSSPGDLVWRRVPSPLLETALTGRHGRSSMAVRMRTKSTTALSVCQRKCVPIGSAAQSAGCDRKISETAKMAAARRRPLPRHVGALRARSADHHERRCRRKVADRAVEAVGPDHRVPDPVEAHVEGREDRGGQDGRHEPEAEISPKCQQEIAVDEDGDQDQVGQERPPVRDGMEGNRRFRRSP